MKRRFEETLEVCLAALVRGQSTVEECLSLYPELSAELEPLLHTARRLQKAYAAGPSPLYVQAARQRFLATMAYRRQRRLAARPVRPSWRWVPAAVGSVALVGFAAWASVLALGGGGGSQKPSMSVAEITSTSTPVATVAGDIQGQVARVQDQLEQIRTGMESGTVEPVAIQQLKEDTAALVASLDQPQGLEPEAMSQIGELFADQEKVLSEAKEKVPLLPAEDLDEIIRIAGAGRAKVEELLSPTATATPSATPTATPSATPSATLTPTATPEESPTSTVTPTVTPSATVTPEVTPTETPQPTPSPPPEGGEEPIPPATATP
jgi:TolA-binding protein